MGLTSVEPLSRRRSVKSDLPSLTIERLDSLSSPKSENTADTEPAPAEGDSEEGESKEEEYVYESRLV